MHNKTRLRWTLTLCTAVALGACGGSKDEAKPADAKDAKAAAKTDAKADTKDDSKGGADADAKAADASDAEKPAAKEAAPGGGGDGSDLLAYVPDGANLIASTDFKAFFASGLGQYYKLALSQLEGESADVLNAAVACKVGPETWTAAVIGADTNKQDASVFAFQGTGLGKKETLECLAEKAKAAGANEDWKVGETNGKTSVDIGEGKGKAFSVNDDLVVLAGKDFIDPVTKLLAGEGSAATAGSLKEPLATVDRSKTIFIAGVAPADMPPGPMTGLSHGSATIDVSAGLALAMRMDFQDAEKAKAASDMFQQQVDQLKPMAGAFAPPSVMESFTIKAEDKTVTGSIKATDDELKQIQEKVAATMGGAMGGAPGGAPPAAGAAPQQAPGGK